MSQKILHAAIALVMISAIAFAAQMSINSTTAVSANILTNHSATVTTSTNISGSASGSTSNSTSGHHTGSHNLSTTSTSVVGVSSGGANPTVTSANVHASIQALSSANAKLTSQAINSQYSHISCQVNFTVSFLNNIIAAAPNESSTLNPLITALQQDSLQLHSYEASNNSTAFHAYISSTYNPEFKTANSGAKSALKSITNQTTRKALRTQYNSAASIYQSCSVDALKNLEQEKLQYYQNEMAKYEIQVTTLSSRGIATASINATLNGANATIILPFQNAMTSATNTSQIAKAINTYCLFNGCKTGINYHLAAKFSDDKLQAILSKIETLNLSANQTVYTTEAQNDINSASSTLQLVGTAQYQGSQSETIWGNLKNASMIIGHIRIKSSGSASASTK